jgi:hypothetical protein
MSTDFWVTVGILFFAALIVLYVTGNGGWLVELLTQMGERGQG